MDPAGFIFVLFGAVSVIWPYKLARFSEQLDAIGSKRPLESVEPAEWTVELTRIVGVLMIVFGVGMVLFG
jgi:hypothetical protein